MKVDWRSTTGLWWLTIIGVVAGTLTLVSALAESTSAPQQAAGAAVAVAFVALPYCFARAAEGIRSERERNDKPFRVFNTKKVPGMRGKRAGRSAEVPFLRIQVP
jgi:hypothetical protein